MSENDCEICNAALSVAGIHPHDDLEAVTEKIQWAFGQTKEALIEWNKRVLEVGLIFERLAQRTADFDRITRAASEALAQALTEQQNQREEQPCNPPLSIETRCPVRDVCAACGRPIFTIRARGLGITLAREWTHGGWGWVDRSHVPIPSRHKYKVVRR